MAEPRGRNSQSREWRTFGYERPLAPRAGGPSETRPLRTNPRNRGPRAGPRRHPIHVLASVRNRDEPGALAPQPTPATAASYGTVRLVRLDEQRRDRHIRRLEPTGRRSDRLVVLGLRRRTTRQRAEPDAHV